MKLVNAGLELRKPLPRVTYGVVIFTIAWLLFLLVMANGDLKAQNTPAEFSTQAGPTAGSDSTTDQAVGVERVEDGVVNNVEAEGINIFSLIVQGGAFTIPIGLMSLVTVTFVIERSMALRRDRVIPGG